MKKIKEVREESNKEPRVREELSWSAAEHGYVEKDVRWYLAIGGLTLFFLILALWQKNFFFAVFIVLAGAVLASLGKRRPKVYAFRITAEGVSIGDKFMPFERLESFALRPRANALDELILKQKTYVNPYLRIPIDGKTASRAREMLATKLPEVEYPESLLDTFADWFGL